MGLRGRALVRRAVLVCPSQAIMAVLEPPRPYHSRAVLVFPLADKAGRDVGEIIAPTRSASPATREHRRHPGPRRDALTSYKGAKTKKRGNRYLTRGATLDHRSRAQKN